MKSFIEKFVKTALWVLNTVAAVLGWLVIAAFTLAGGRLIVFAWLQADFWGHVVTASDEARQSFFAIVLPIFILVVCVVLYTRRHAAPFKLEGAVK